MAQQFLLKLRDAAMQASDPVSRCMAPVRELNHGLKQLLVGHELTAEDRAKFEVKIMLADRLELYRDALNSAFEQYELPDASDPTYFEKLSEKNQLRDASSLRSEIRVFYASRLSSTKSLADWRRAVELLNEAVTMDGWQRCPGLIKSIIERLGDVEKLPEHVYEAYDSCVKQIEGSRGGSTLFVSSRR